jgi:hypothetical protein
LVLRNTLGDQKLDETQLLLQGLRGKRASRSCLWHQRGEGILMRRGKRVRRLSLSLALKHALILERITQACKLSSQIPGEWVYSLTIRLLCSLVYGLGDCLRNCIVQI